jgi:hypothetical protein
MAFDVADRKTLSVAVPPGFKIGAGQFSLTAGEPSPVPDQSDCNAVLADLREKPNRVSKSKVISLAI